MRPCSDHLGDASAPAACIDRWLYITTGRRDGLRKPNLEIVQSCTAQRAAETCHRRLTDARPFGKTRDGRPRGELRIDENFLGEATVGLAAGRGDLAYPRDDVYR